MKKVFLLISLILCANFGLMPLVQAQNCTPDSSYSSPGVYPDSIPGACINQFYDLTLTAIIPMDTTVVLPPPFGTVTLPIDSVILDNIVGLPAGITYVCNPSSCTFLGGSINCLQLSGTPTTADTFDISIIATMHSFFAGNPVNLTDTLDGFELIVHPEPTVNASIDWTGCAEDGSGSISLSPGGSGSPYSYNWSTSDTTATISGLAPGMYNVDFVDVHGCASTDNFSVEAPDSLIILFEGAFPTTCAGDSNGSAIVMGDQGVPPYQTSWTMLGQMTPIQSGDTLKDVPAGEYTATVTDAAGCSRTFSVIIFEPTPLEIQFSSSDESVMGANDGHAVATASGGNGNYTYNWSNGAMTDSIGGLAPGTYIVEVQDMLGCTTIDSVVIQEGPVSIADQLGWETFEVYPNPTRDVLRVHWKQSKAQNVQLTLINLQGAVLWQKNIPNAAIHEEVLDLNSFPAGMYQLRIQSAHQAATQSILLVRN